jgi:DNA-binding Lrp family transcriptional regulator
MTAIIYDIAASINQSERLSLAMARERENAAGLPISRRFTVKEVHVARRLQGDIPLAEHPFLSIAEEVGLTEREVLSIVKRLIAREYIRKFGAIIRHQMAGYRDNAMVVWAAPQEQCDAIGRRLASFPEITHCYERTPAFEGRYTLFTMIHFRPGTEKELLKTMADATALYDFKILRSLEEFKKNSMEYF